MPRPSTAHLRRREYVAILAEAFADTGYRRATTAELARRCNVPENSLYRLWPDKKRMYLDALQHLYDGTVEIWTKRLAAGASRGSSAEQLLEYEGVHYGEHRFYRILFSGLSEIDDPDIGKALRRTYRSFHAFIAEHIAEHRRGARLRGGEVVDLLAWVILGMGTVSGIGRELGLITKQQQQKLFSSVGKGLLAL